MALCFHLNSSNNFDELLGNQNSTLICEDYCRLVHYRFYVRGRNFVCYLNRDLEWEMFWIIPNLEKYFRVLRISILSGAVILRQVGELWNLESLSRLSAFIFLFHSTYSITKFIAVINRLPVSPAQCILTTSFHIPFKSNSDSVHDAYKYPFTPNAKFRVEDGNKRKI